MTDETPDRESGGEHLLSARIVPVRREGNKVFVRTLRHDEEDTGEGVDIRAGDNLIFAAGDLTINSRQMDAQSKQGLGGYAPVANTVWTWYQIIGEEAGFFIYFFALARRTDAAHALWALAIQERDKAKQEGAISQRIGFLNAMATAEVAIIALHRGFTMVSSLGDKFQLDVDVPPAVIKIGDAVREMRNAFEHIDERAQGKIGWSGGFDPEALTIFNQPDFIESSVLTYKNYTVNFKEDILSALLECREFIMSAIDARATGHAARTHPQGG